MRQDNELLAEALRRELAEESKGYCPIGHADKQDEEPKLSSLSEFIEEYE